MNGVLVKKMSCSRLRGAVLARFGWKIQNRNPCSSLAYTDRSGARVLASSLALHCSTVPANTVTLPNPRRGAAWIDRLVRECCTWC